MYYEDVTSDLEELFTEMVQSVNNTDGHTLQKIAAYFNFILLNRVFSSYLKGEVEKLRGYRYHSDFFHPLIFYSVAFYSSITKLDEYGFVQIVEVDKKKQLEAYGCLPTEWMTELNWLVFKQLSDVQWRQELLNKGQVIALTNWHFGLKASIVALQEKEGLIPLEDGDIPMSAHVVLRSGDIHSKNKSFLLLREVAPNFFSKKVKISPLASNLLLHLKQTRDKTDLATLFEKLGTSEGNLGSLKNVKSDINKYCRKTGLTDLILSKSGYRLNPDVTFLPIIE